MSAQQALDHRRQQPSFLVWDALYEGIELSGGYKLQIQKALGLASLFVLLTYFLFQQLPILMLAGNSVKPTMMWLLLLGQLIVIFASAPLAAGSILLGAQRATGGAINQRLIFECYKLAGKLFVAYLITCFFVMAGTFFFLLPGIYLFVCYLFAMPLAADKNISAWQALSLSRTTVHADWFRYFGLCTLLLTINILAALPLGIGLIWTVPWTINTLGVVYRDVFGYEARTY